MNMSAIRHIRTDLFKVSQAAFAVIAGTNQSAVSRWENNSSEPDRDELARIRAEALRRGLAWDDRLFFEAPEQVAS